MFPLPACIALFSSFTTAHWSVSLVLIGQLVFVGTLPSLMQTAGNCGNLLMSKLICERQQSLANQSRNINFSLVTAAMQSPLGCLPPYPLPLESNNLAPKSYIDPSFFFLIISLRVKAFLYYFCNSTLLLLFLAAIFFSKSCNLTRYAGSRLAI